MNMVAPHDDDIREPAVGVFKPVIPVIPVIPVTVRLIHAVVSGLGVVAPNLQRRVEVPLQAPKTHPGARPPALSPAA